MNCNHVQSLLNEFTDEKLDAGTTWQVQTHLSDCDACGKIQREIVSVQRLLQALPTAAPSAGFDAALAQRLALTRRTAAAPPSFRTKLLVFATPARRLRSAAALSLVLAVGTFAALYPGRTPVPIAVPIVHAADPSFVADCVAQHHRDAATEPLADLSAQTLAGSLDSASAADTPAGPNAPTDSSLL